MLYEMGSYKSVVGDYAVHNVRKFEKALCIYMRKNKFTSSTKVSRVFIEENETKINLELNPDQEINEIFQ